MTGGPEIDCDLVVGQTPKRTHRDKIVRTDSKGKRQRAQEKNFRGGLHRPGQGLVIQETDGQQRNFRGGQTGRRPPGECTGTGGPEIDGDLGMTDSKENTP